MHPKDLSIKDFSYDLPDERIAKYPLAERDLSKLLIYNGSGTDEESTKQTQTIAASKQEITAPIQKESTSAKTSAAFRSKISQSSYRNIFEVVPEGSLLVFNNTKVVEARILFQKPSGATIEIFCLEPDDRYPDITTAMLQSGKLWWKCLVGGAKKWKEPLLTKTILQGDKKILLTAERKAQIEDYYLIEFNWDDNSLSFAEILHAAGLIPLPPYLNRTAETSDLDRYQTIYAKYNGSVAAPTAGLHFTDTIFEKLATKNISKEYLTLHVGAGTFKPVKAEKIEDHDMHAEFIEVRIDFIQKLIDQISKQGLILDSTNLPSFKSPKIIPVGTTSMRTIESLYWLGVKTILQTDITLSELVVHQWDPYNIDAAGISATSALTALLNWMQNNETELLITKTQIIIAPGYDFKIAQALITNFHQPQSTLLLLVSALIGDNWKKVYQYALDNDFRFLSYGDGCYLSK
ncbi:MAG: S-adenosylmethionine:tRNA ribosyltransferase-isomerase [Bacteroidetes bacterium]|nr:S-adenosylmethionine:tRNA ribosyltransferase-isomerase [Bacteroidota bacterium]